jgi:hypothetical protein
MQKLARKGLYRDTFYAFGREVACGRPRAPGCVVLCVRRSRVVAIRSSGTVNRRRYGSVLDTFIPVYEVVERHHVHVAAPAEITLAAATEMDIQQSAIIRAIFKGREWIMGSRAARDQIPRAFLSQMLAIGWGVLSEIQAREIVMGAVTRPWMADVVFRTLPPEEFMTFREPGYVKIAWTLRADPINAGESVFRTETRVATTDPAARARFRRYWSFFSPGITLIRRVSLGLVKAEAERRAREARSKQHTAEPQRI